MSKGNPDISLDIYHAIVPILHAEKTPTLACADIMRIPLEQVVDGSVYQFELVHACGKCHDGHICEIDARCIGSVNGDCPQTNTPAHCYDQSVKCACNGKKQTKRISHYDLADADIAMAYCDLVGAIELDVFEKVVVNKGTLRAIKIREVSK